MEPAIKTGQQVIVNKTAYLFSDPKRGDIVLFDSPVSDKGLVKRIIGLPGEVIGLRNKKVYIDGYLLQENYAQYIKPGVIFVGDNIEPFTIPQHNYFVMGDNRDVSRDSRDWSEAEGLQTETISRREIKGKVLFFF